MNYLQRKKQALTSQIQQGILPFGYRQVEYLESTGTQYIVTGYRLLSRDVVQYDCTLQFTSKDKEAQYFGVFGGAYFGARQNKYAFANVDTNKEIGNKDVVKFIANTNTGDALMYVNYELIGTTNRSYKYLAITLFKLIDYPGFECFCRLYDFKLTINGILVRDYIPCLDTNGTPCMYDTVSKKTYYNKGTGEFLYGEVIN